MAQRNHRVDRFAQMSKQEEIIAKKRQEILEKQRTAQLAKAVAAAQTLAAQLKTMETPMLTPGAAEAATAEPDEEEQEEELPAVPQPLTVLPADDGNALEVENGEQPGSAGKGKCDDLTPKTLNSFTGKTGKITFSLKRQQLPQPSVEQPPPKVKNTFCNDGSFLENFKKILEKHEQPKPPIMVAPVPSTEENNTGDSHSTGNNSPQQSLDLAVGTIATSAAAVIATSMAGSMTVANAGPNHLAFSMAGPGATMPQAVQPPPPPPFAFNPTLLAQGPPQMQLPAFFHGHHHLLHPAAVAPPPPPPPPQLPIALANLTPIYMQLGPTQMPSEAAMHQLNAIPAPKEFDLNAIPKPQINLEAIQMPNVTQSEQLGLLPEHVTVNPPPPPPPPMQPEEQVTQLPPQQPQQQQQQIQQLQPILTPPPQGFFMIRAASNIETIANNCSITDASVPNDSGSSS
ncbi:formin-like protein 20 isoform X5 [Drosophila innubila]|uniref:formin-like protein 20 isoform X5 n=1 Tax=Drosophila innubila TaxID=198719 RepID=UPI00148D52B4|nr:formin-like protein 20 isoform X5 [Drosophila innubila]